MVESDYLKHIQHAFPSLDIHNVTMNCEGMINTVVIVNQARVFRFPRDARGVTLQRQEMKVLDLLRAFVDLPVPDWDYRSDVLVSYPFIPGEPLLSDDVARMNEREQEAIAEMLAVFLKQMHSIPMTELKQAGIQQSESARSRDDWLQLYEDVQAHLYPLMWADGREWVRRHFAPLIADESFMRYEPRFMMGDLASYHVLFDPQSKVINGIIDFGTAGAGDPADDFALIINQYGESFLRRMQHAYPEVAEHIHRARFIAGTLELAWLLRGIQKREDDMFVVHIGRRRDMMPVESDW